MKTDTYVPVITKKVATRTTAMTNTYGLQRKEIPASGFSLQRIVYTWICACAFHIFSHRPCTLGYNLISMMLFTFIVPDCLCVCDTQTVGNRTRRRTGGIQQKITQYARGCLYSKKVKLLMMSSLQLETCRVKDD